MDFNIVKEDWDMVAEKIKARWDRITSEDLEIAENNQEYLIGKLQEYYDLGDREIEKNLEEIGYIL